MSGEKYDLHIGSAAFDTFFFISSGSKGDIPLMVAFTETKNKNVFNLGLGALDPKQGKFSDSYEVGNGDRNKILRTVASSVYYFLEKYPDAFVLFEGNTTAKTRLYRMGITINLIELGNDFIIEGYIDGAWHPFEKGKGYEKFLIHRKM